MDEIPYDRQAWIKILVYHWRKDITGCGCGWAELGESWPAHLVREKEI